MTGVRGVGWSYMRRTAMKIRLVTNSNKHIIDIISISSSLMNVLSKIVELYRKKVGAFNPKCGEYQTLFLF